MSRDLTGMSQVTFTWEVENTLLAWQLLPLEWFFKKYFELCEYKYRSRQPKAFTFQERRSASIGSGIVRSRPGLSPTEIFRRRGTMQNNFITIIIFRSKRQIYFLVIFLLAVAVAVVHSLICSFSNFVPLGPGWQEGTCQKRFSGFCPLYFWPWSITDALQWVIK